MSRKDTLKALLKRHIPEGIDVDAMMDYWDNTLTYEENKNLLIEKAKEKTMYSEDQSLKELQEETERIKAENVIRQKEFIAAEFERQIQIIKEGDVHLDKFYGDLPHYLDMFNKGFIKCVIITGKAGGGKTFQAKSKVDELVTIGGHISAYQLFQKLYENKDREKILFDDIESLLENKDTIALLKQALDTNEPRIISWFTTRPSDIPQQFEFNSSVVFCINEIPTNKGFEPIASRSLTYNVDFTWEEMIQMMYIFSKKPREINNITISPKERHEIIDYIREHSSEATLNFNLRTLDKVERFFAFNRDTWKKRVEHMLNKEDDTLSLIMRLIRDYGRTKDQLKHFNEESGLGRATFFRYKKKVSLSNRLQNM